MTESELRTIEDRLAISLPEVYRSIVLDYPFPLDSLGAECMLLDDAEQVIDLNNAGAEVDGVDSPFFIGSDCGEEWYFMNLSDETSRVFVYHLETGKHHSLDESLEQFLGRIRTAHEEIEADEREMEERRRTRKWWEFWK